MARSVRSSPRTPAKSRRKAVKAAPRKGKAPSGKKKAAKPPAPKWRRRSEARPAEIASAAYSVFAEKGFAAARLDDIAQAAGVSKGALYLYFETKQDIFEAVVREALAPNLAAVEQVAESHAGPFGELMRMMLPRLAQVAGSSPLGKVMKLVIAESGNFPELARIWHDTLVARGLGVLTKLVSKAQARGEVRPGDPRAHAVTLMSPILVAVIFRETFEPVGAKGFDIPALMNQHLDTVLPGLLTTPTKGKAR